jgi:hypothetical protein
MPLTRDERKLLHQKFKQPTMGVGKPDRSSGHEGDISFRQVQGSGTVQYLKQNGDWIALSSSGQMPQVRSVGSRTSSTSVSVANHSSLGGLLSDDHTQYVLVDGTRAFNGNWTNASNTIADLGTVTTVDINGGTIDGTTIGANSHTTIKGTTIDATTDFTIGGTVITDGNIDDTGTLNIDGATGINLQEGGGTAIAIDTNRNIFFNQYAQTLFQQYGFHNKIEKYHQTSGRADYNQNYSILSIHLESASFNTSYGA